MKMAITTAYMSDLQAHSTIGRCIASQINTVSNPRNYERVARINSVVNPSENLGVTGSLQWLYAHTTAPIMAFIHSDVEIFEQNWDERVLRELDDPQVGVVGFGGALQLGEDDIYKKPYQLQQLRRIHYMSNQNDAETHGERFIGECDVATLDGFVLIVRRDLLDRWWTPKEGWKGFGQRGWPIDRYPFHNYDNAICLEAAKQGYRVRLVGIKCHHHGGATSTTAPVQEYWKSQGTSDQEIHTQSHLHLYEDGRGWLPLRVGVKSQHAHHNHLPSQSVSSGREGLHVAGDSQGSSIVGTGRPSGDSSRLERGVGVRGEGEAVLPVHQGQWLTIPEGATHVRLNGNDSPNANGPEDQPSDKGGNPQC